MKATRAEVRLSELAKVDGGGDRPGGAEEGRRRSRCSPSSAKVVLSGEIEKAVTLKGVGATKGARAAIEAAGGKIEA